MVLEECEGLEGRLLLPDNSLPVNSPQILPILERDCKSRLCQVVVPHMTRLADSSAGLIHKGMA